MHTDAVLMNSHTVELIFSEGIAQDKIYLLLN